MAQYSNLKAYIEEKIYENGTQAITGDILQDVLKVMTDDLGEFYQTGGVASPSTDPGTPDAKVIYIATEAGTYTNFGGITLAAGEVALLIFETSWTKETLNVLSAANGGVKAANLADGAVTTEKIAGGAVETAKIANNAVTSGKVADGAIGTAKIADGAIDADKIAANAVESAKIKNGAVTEGKINDGAVTAGKVAANAVTTAKIADDAVTTAKLNDGAVTEDKIATDAVTSGKVKDGAIGTAKIAAGAVTHAKIGAGAVEESNIKDGAVTSDKIANGAVGSDQLAEGAFSAENLADGSVTTDKLADGAVTAEKIADGAVTADKFANGSVTTIKLGSGAVTTEKIGDGMVTRQKLADSSVGTSKIIDGAVTTDKVADGAITDAKLENPVSVSQNTSTGHIDITIGSTITPVASVDEVSQLGQRLIKLEGFWPTGDLRFMEMAVGQFAVNSLTHNIVERIEESPWLRIVPKYDGAIYTYNNIPYFWNGESFVEQDTANIFLPISLEMTVGGFWSAEFFSFQESQNWSTSQPISVVSGQQFKISSATNQYVLKVAFFDSLPTTGAVPLSSSIQAADTQVTSLSEMIIDVPNDAQYMIISSYSATGLISSVSEMRVCVGNQELADELKRQIDNIPIYDESLNNDILENLSDVNLILIYGQSLSVGADTQPAISLSNKYRCNYKLGNSVIHTSESQQTLASMNLQPLTEVTYETPASGCAEKLIEIIQQETGLSCYSKYWNSKRFVYASCGEGGVDIATLYNPTGDLFNGLKNVIQRVYNICVANNWTFNVPAFIWIQGESDQKHATTYATYKSTLVSLRNNIDTYVKSLNSQINDVKCVCYQTCSSNTAFGTGISGNDTLPITHDNALIKMAVPMAQMELVRDEAEFSAAAPTYCIDHNMNDIHVTPANIHLNNIGSKMEGCIAAIALKRILFNEDENNGVVPLTYSVLGNDLIIKYEANTKPLRKETEFVAEVENLGFKVINTSDNDIITSVEVFNDSVTIHCSESPIGAIAVYGYNGEDGYDGRIKGGRGNIADMSGYIYSANIGKFHYLLNNYAFCLGFEVRTGTNNIVTQDTE